MKLLFSIVLATSLMACKKNGGTDSPASTASTMRDVAYGSDPAQKMDIYLPSGRSSSATKVMVLVHGGGWTGGDKSEFDPYIQTLMQRLPDYALFNVNYRLATSNNNRFPTQENDIKSAIEFISNKAGEYKVSQNVVLMGFSAGAHLALLQGYKYTLPIKPKAIVSFFGPTDLVDMYNNPTTTFTTLLLEALIGANPQQNLGAYQQSSPAFFVNGSSAPTIILHGGQDNLVSPTQATILNNKLQASGVAHQYVFYPNEGHGWFGPSLEDSFNKIEAFLDLHVK
ncbi:MAG TPA: alpha/beta hydrolase [Chitinophagaceae bacterium]|nr:alpha/beta hydrolase [Chitinophagaceae bacterium]